MIHFRKHSARIILFFVFSTLRMIFLIKILECLFYGTRPIITINLRYEIGESSAIPHTVGFHIFL